MITKKLRIFHPRPNNFVIVNCETITLLTRSLFPAGQHNLKPATVDHPRDFFSIVARVSSAQAKSDHLDDEMSCRMVREVCWWCACRASGGAHLVCAWCSACVCRQVHIFVSPDAHFGVPEVHLVVRMVIFGPWDGFWCHFSCILVVGGTWDPGWRVSRGFGRDFRRFFVILTTFSLFWSGFSTKIGQNDRFSMDFGRGPPPLWVKGGVPPPLCPFPRVQGVQTTISRAFRSQNGSKIGQKSH